MRLQFNTGRLYSARGQVVVAATQSEPMGIKFSDKDRGIDGFIPLLRLPENDYVLKVQAMHNYDFGNYVLLDIPDSDKEMRERS